jgi:hypothetical protein
MSTVPRKPYPNVLFLFVGVSVGFVVVKAVAWTVELSSQEMFVLIMVAGALGACTAELVVGRVQRRRQPRDR